MPHPALRTLARSPLVVLLAAALSSAACGPATARDDAGDAGSTTDARRTDDASSRDDAAVDDDSGDPGGDGSSPANRDFTLRARDMTMYQGRALGAWVCDATGRSVMAYQYLASISDAEFDLRMPDLVPEGDYTADVFVDANGNGTYDGPMVDPSWRVPVPTQGSAMVAVAASDSVTNLNDPPRVPRRDAVIQLSGFVASEMGQRLELRVIDQGSRATVGGYIQPQLPGNSLSITLPGVVDDGNTYDVDFWVDADSSGTYSGPGSDHTWHATATATGSGLMLSWTRDENYVELNWR